MATGLTASPVDDVGNPDRALVNRSPWFPDGYEAFFAVRDGILSGRFRGEQTDHLVWTAIVTCAEIEVLLDELYGPIGDFEARHAGSMEHLADSMRDLREFVAGLQPDGEYMLMADEF
jgi:hypothetical protein